MENFNSLLDSCELPVLVEFFASWCPHCQKMMPVMLSITEKYKGKIKVLQYDIDKNTALADNLGVEGTPTFFIYKNGEKVWQQAGEMPENTLERYINRFI